MFARKFNKYMKMKKFGNGRRPQRRKMIKWESNKRENNPVICYECKKLGHIKFECPFWKHNKKSQIRK